MSRATNSRDRWSEAQRASRGTLTRKPKATLLPAPEGITGLAKQEWDRVALELVKSEIPAEEWRVRMLLYTTALERWQKAERMIAETGGEIVRSPNGFPIQNPWASVSKEARGQVESAIRKMN